MKGYKRCVEYIRQNLFEYQTENRTKNYLALNENPFPFPRDLLRDVFNCIDEKKLPIYYDSPDDELLNLLLKYVGNEKLNKKNISIGNGADEIIYYLLLMFKELETVVFPPTYSCYELFARDVGVKVVSLPLLDERIPLDKAEKLLNENTVVFLPSPNNPTGHYFEDEEIERLLSTNALVVVDEAYYEFGKKSYVSWIGKYENLVVIRTFSKAFSLAAQRIGYIVGSESLIDAYNRIRLPFNVDYVSQVFAKIALKNLHIFEERIDLIINEREKVKKKLVEFGFKVSDSKGNFVFVYLEQKIREKLLDMLKKKEITVRKFPQGLRITIGFPEQNEKVLATFMEVRENEN